MAEDNALEWNDLMVILAIGRARSLSGAARLLGQNHSTVFRRINAIEERTGVRFFERLPKGYFLTDAGETALACAERIESEVHALGREVLGQDMRLQGKVRLTAPEGVAAFIAPRLLAQFRALHPEVRVELDGGALAADLTRREADIAIRATGKPPDASLGRKVCPFRFAVYATERYLAEHPGLPLCEHQWCLLHGITDWLTPWVWKKVEQAHSRIVFSGGFSITVIEATCQDMGLTLQPCYLGDAEPRLVRATEPVETLTLNLWLLTHPDLRHTARVKALMDFLHAAFTKERTLYEGGRARAGWKPPIALSG
ncbi:MAG: LysR family transcriptional regulator [Myxococcales bacterium]|nr:LysR family transcriptional regulator [Myxococcales bacterium]